MPAAPKKPKIRISLPKGSKIESVPWKAIIEAFYEQLRISKEKKEAVVRSRGQGERLEKKLEMARMLIFERVNSSGEGAVVFDSSFLVELVKLLRLCEQLIVIDELETELWTQFLSIMIDKMKKEKLVVYRKPQQPEPAKKQQEPKPRDEMKKDAENKRLSNVYTKL